MFGINWPELLLIGVVAVIVIGPKDLPPLMRQAGRMARKGRMFYEEMRQHWDDLPNQIDLADMQKEADLLQKKTNAKYVGDAEPPMPEPAAKEAMGSDDPIIPLPPGGARGGYTAKAGEDFSGGEANPPPTPPKGRGEEK